MWVPLIENNEHLDPGADYFVQKYLHGLLSQSSEIDTIVFGMHPLPFADAQDQALAAGGRPTHCPRRHCGEQFGGLPATAPRHGSLVQQTGAPNVFHHRIARGF